MPMTARRLGTAWPVAWKRPLSPLVQPSCPCCGELLGLATALAPRQSGVVTDGRRRGAELVRWRSWTVPCMVNRQRGDGLVPGGAIRAGGWTRADTRDEARQRACHRVGGDRRLGGDLGSAYD